MKGARAWNAYYNPRKEATSSSARATGIPPCKVQPTPLFTTSQLLIACALPRETACAGSQPTWKARQGLLLFGGQTSRDGTFCRHGVLPSQFEGGAPQEAAATCDRSAPCQQLEKIKSLHLFA